MHHWQVSLALVPSLNEIILLHKPSKTLVVTDLAFNFEKGG
jgi:hypothetical protein